MSWQADRQIFYWQKKRLSRLICHRNKRYICTCIYKIVNLLKSYDNIHNMTYITMTDMALIAIYILYSTAQRGDRLLTWEPDVFWRLMSILGRVPWCSGSSCLVGMSRDRGFEPALAFSFKETKCFLSAHK